MKLCVCREEEGDFRHEHQQDGDHQQNADNHEHVGDGLLNTNLKDSAGGEQTTLGNTVHIKIESNLFL